MNLIIAILWIASTFAVLPILHAGYEIPKLVIASVAAGLAALFCRNVKIALSPFVVGWLALAALTLTQFTLGNGNAPVTTILIGTGLYLWAHGLQDQERTQLRDWYFQAAAGHSLILITQIIAPSFWESLDIGFVPSRSSSLIGNREFYATFVGSALLLRFPTFAELFRKKPTILLLTLWMFGSLLFVRSKGTVFLVSFLWAAPFLREMYVRMGRWKFVTLLLAMAGAIATLSTISGRARILLAVVASQIGADDWAFGVGLGRFGHHYFNALESFFGRNPILRDHFGDLSGVITDAHNIVLHLWAEAGIIGLAGSLLLLYGLFSRGSQSLGSKLSIFVAAKLCYTVVLGSVTSLSTLAIALALTEGTLKKEETRTKFSLVTPLLVALLCGGWYQTAKKASFEWHYSKAYRDLQLGRVEQADPSFLRALEIDHKSAEAWLGRAYVALRSRPPRDPEPFLTQALESRSDFNILKLAARVYFSSGDCWNAEAIYTRVRVAFPQHLTSLAHMAQCEMKFGRIEAARTLAKEIIRIQPRVPNKSYARNLLFADEILKETEDALESGRLQ